MSRYTLLLASCCWLSIASTVCAQDAPAAPAKTNADWPQFLGPQRNGISLETGLLKSWPTGGLREVWRTAGGVGMSGCAIHEGRLYTMAQRDGQQFVLALDAKAGTPLWSTAVAKAYRNSMGNGPRSTPAVANGRVFAFTGEGILAALSAADGAVVWQRNTIDELGGRVPDYGMASSPLVDGDNIIVTVGAEQATVVAYDAATGKPTWQAGSKDPAGYSSPTILDIGGKRQVVVFNGAAAIGVEPKTGAALWRYPYTTDYNCNIATPLAFNGQLFLSSGENHGCVLLNLQPNNDGFQISETWKSLGSQSVLRNEWQTSILLGDFLYGFDNVGSAGPVTHLNCVNIKSGERVWQQQRFGKGNLIAADGKLLITTMKGDLIIASATPEGYQELGRANVLETTRQAPALAGGLLYLRDDRDVVCLDVRQ